MTEDRIYTVEEMSCGHCKATVESAVGAVEGVVSVEADLETKLVVVRGAANDAAIRAAIEDAGYAVA
ncbi:MAG: copper chaperone [Thermoleophilia bacterium]|nr:copper chaperone [Thermoleophilia bacterium]